MRLRWYLLTWVVSFFVVWFGVIAIAEADVDATCTQTWAAGVATLFYGIPVAFGFYTTFVAALVAIRAWEKPTAGCLLTMVGALSLLVIGLVWGALIPLVAGLGTCWGYEP